MAVLFTVLLGSATFILSFMLYRFDQQNFIHATELIIDAEIDDIATWQPLSEELLQKINNKDKKSNRYYILFTQKNKRIAGNLLALPAQPKKLSEGIIHFSIEEKEVAAKIHTFENGDRLLVGYDITSFMKQHQQFQLLSGIIILFMFAVIFVSFAISGFVVSRINRITDTAHNIIKTGDLSQRLEIDSHWDDLSNMAKVLNLMLNRIEGLMKGIKTVSDNIAHDLRTPLTRLRSKLEYLPEDVSEPLTKEADQLLATFSALLRISNIETGKRHNRFKNIDIAKVMIDAIDLYTPLIEEKKITLETKIKSTSISGDKDLLFQVCANLIDNAVKYTPEEGHLDIAVTDQRSISIADNGTGIPDKDIKHVFDRFYRADDSRSKPGNGLGLSLVKAVLDLHNANIILSNNHPGLKVTISF